MPELGAELRAVFAAVMLSMALSLEEMTLTFPGGVGLLCFVSRVWLRTTSSSAAPAATAARASCSLE